MSVIEHRTPQRGYPHVVTQGGRLNLRRSIEFVERASSLLEMNDPCVFLRDGHIDAAGEINAAGEAAVLDRFVGHAKRRADASCIVWARHRCTWIDDGGRTTPGSVPPRGEIVQPHLLDDFDALIEHVWTIRLPDGSAASHLCLRRIDAALVEITPGEPTVLGSFFDLPKGGRHDPAAAMTTRGRLKPPVRFRGELVTGVRDRMDIMGPVQPCGEGVILRNPWPDDIRRACDRVAGRVLGRHLHQAAWNALNPADPTINHVGVLKAA